MGSGQTGIGGKHPAKIGSSQRSANLLSMSSDVPMSGGLETGLGSTGRWRCNARSKGSDDGDVAPGALSISLAQVAATAISRKTRGGRRDTGLRTGNVFVFHESRETNGWDDSFKLLLFRFRSATSLLAGRYHRIGKKGAGEEIRRAVRSPQPMRRSDTQCAEIIMKRWRPVCAPDGFRRPSSRSARSGTIARRGTERIPIVQHFLLDILPLRIPAI